MDILEQIIATKQEEVAAAKAKKPSLREALLNSPTGIIAEFKRRSPSKGWINEAARPDIVPLSYQHNGAAALSILTDTQYFGGDDRFIVEARRSGVTLPVLYKNFVIDESQLYQALLCGASAVLLIAACLSKAQCKQLLDKAHTLGLEVLLEMHSEEELEYAELQPDLCGINNRNLGSFVTDVDNSFRLAEKLRAIVGHASQRDESGIVGHASQRDESSIVGHASQRDESGIVGHASQRDESGIVGHASQRDESSIVGHASQRDESSIVGHASQRDESGQGGDCNAGKRCPLVFHPSQRDKFPLLVSESGISSPATIRQLRQAGFRGFLIGETFMKTADPGKALADFIAAIDSKT